MQASSFPLRNRLSNPVGNHRNHRSHAHPPGARLLETAKVIRRQAKHARRSDRALVPFSSMADARVETRGGDRLNEIVEELNETLLV